MKKKHKKRLREVREWVLDLQENGASVADRLKWLREKQQLNCKHFNLKIEIYMDDCYRIICADCDFRIEQVSTKKEAFKICESHYNELSEKE